jgi:hypothetical protein
MAYNESDDKILAVVGEFESGRDIIRVLVASYKDGPAKIRIWRLYTDRLTGQKVAGKLGGILLDEAETLAGLLMEGADKIRELGA